MKNLLSVYFRLAGVAVLAIAVFALSSVLLVKGQDGVITLSANANTDGMDEIVVVGNDGYVYVYNITGTQVYSSPEDGWKYVATGDFDGNGDYEIVAVGGDKIKVYDPQVVGTEFSFDVTYTPRSGCTGGTFTKVGTGDFWNDGKDDIALIRSRNKSGDYERSCIVIYSPASDTNVKVEDNFDYTNWRDFAVGDYDGDDDDDFALIYWNDDYPSGNRNWVELRKGNDPEDKLNDKNAAGSYSNSEWFDIVSGYFTTTNSSRDKWAGSQNTGKNIIVQRWNGTEILDVWNLDDAAYNFLAAGNFRGESYDQLAMLRNVSSGTSMRFAKNGKVWASVSGLGTGWLDIASGNLDTEATYKEVVIIKNNLMRIYKVTQSTSDFLNCNVAGRCFENFNLPSGGLRGSIAVADLGKTFAVIEPYKISTLSIARTVEQSQTVPGATFYIYGDKTVKTPIEWMAWVVPVESFYPKEQFVENMARLSREAQGRELTLADAQRALGLDSAAAEVNWLQIKNQGGLPANPLSGTTPSTITVTFPDTFPGSPIHETGAYKASILIIRKDLLGQYSSVDVMVLVAGTEIYIPLVEKR